jgi:hypothetical protein
MVLSGCGRPRAARPARPARPRRPRRPPRICMHAFWYLTETDPLDGWPPSGVLTSNY